MSWVAVGGAVLVLLLAAIVGRAWLASSKALDEGDRFVAAGRGGAAALAYRRAIAWYFPGNPYVPRAIEAMWRLADDQEAGGDLVAARMTIGDLRGALYAVRSVYQPHEESVRLCDKRLAELLSRTDERVLSGAVGVESVRPRYDEATRRDHAPSVAWSLALGLGFLAWMGFTFGALWRLVPSEAGRSLAWRRAALFGGLSLVSLAVWLLGAALA